MIKTFFKQLRWIVPISLYCFLLLFISCINESEPGCNAPTDDTQVFYAGTHSTEVTKLLLSSKPWKTPKCKGGSNFQQPRKLQNTCLRDQYINGAIDAAFTAEYQWRTGSKDDAIETAKLVRQLLDQADALCSNKPAVCSTCDCPTEKIWPCPVSQSGGGNSNPGTSNNGTSYVAFKNNVFTPVNITYNGTSKVVQPGETASFAAVPGTSGSFSAETSGKTNQGTQVGELVTWTYQGVFPSAGTTTTVQLNLAPQMFFLHLVNSSVRKITKIYVNYGLQSQTVDNLTVPNDGQKYRIGYYRAWTNSNLRLEGENNWVWSWAAPDFKLDFTQNQTYTFTAR